MQREPIWKRVFQQTKKNPREVPKEIRIVWQRFASWCVCHLWGKTICIHLHIAGNAILLALIYTYRNIRSYACTPMVSHVYVIVWPCRHQYLQWTRRMDMVVVFIFCRYISLLYAACNFYGGACSFTVGTWSLYRKKVGTNIVGHSNKYSNRLLEKIL